MKILVTGFEPMRPMYTINPSWEAVRMLPDSIGGAQILKAELPVAWGRTDRMLEELLERERPDALLCTGQSGMHRGLRVERIGINLDDFRVADNDGNLRRDEPIFTGGPDAYFVNLPVREIAEAIVEGGVPAELSCSAGTHLCNHVTYLARHLEKTRFPGLRSGFIHVPLDMSQCVQGSQSYFMDRSAVVNGLTCALEVIAEELRKEKA